MSSKKRKKQVARNPWARLRKFSRSLTGNYSPNGVPLAGQLDLTELEPRILYSAAPIGDFSLDVDVNIDVTGDPFDADFLHPAPVADNTWSTVFDRSDSLLLSADDFASGDTRVHEIVFIDAGVENFDELYRSIVADTESGRQLEFHVLASDQDGVQQISDVLRGSQNVSGIHIVSHGSDGNVQLGITTLNSDTLQAYVGTISEWSDVLSPHADILFYGCNLAGSAAGEEFIASISELTGSDVAASTDITGHSDLEGDWDLEYVLGDINTEIVVGQSSQFNWMGALDITSDLVAHYEFDEGSGSIATDSTGNGHTGTLLGSPVRTTGINGTEGLDFSGNFDRVEIPDDSDFEFGSDDFSVGLWFNTSQLPTTHLRMVGKMNGGDGFEIFTDSFGDVNFRADGTSGSIWIWEGGLLDGNWHHATALRSGDTFELYIDGTLRASTTLAIGGIDNTATVAIGARDATNEDFDGVIDDVRIYDRALSSTDVAELYGTTDTIDVTNTLDSVNGNTSSFAALMSNDGGDGISLREAITAANNQAGTDNIHFEIPDALVGGAHTISVLSALPDITDTVIIDGTTDSDFGTTPIIVLDGISAGVEDGLMLDSGSDGSTIRGLVIQRFADDGIDINGSGNHTIVGNFIGTDVTGTADRGNSDSGIQILNSSNNLIGGTTVADRNIISGNAAGISIDSGSTLNVIQGNYIGVDVTGNVGIGNTNDSILIGSGASNTTIGGDRFANEGNVISAGGHGVHLSGNNNIVQGNWIGTNSSDDNLGNIFGGIYIDSSSSGNLIGGTNTGQFNTIAHNTSDGIRITGSGDGNSIVGNYIYDNSGQGIDIDGSGVTPNDLNDVDSGANDGQNFPVLTQADLSGSDLTLSGSLDTDGLNTQYHIEFFGNVSGTQDATNGEGRFYLGSTTVTTNGSGDATFSGVVLSGVTLNMGDFITATATVIDDPGQVGSNDQLAYGSTSEFATNLTISSPNSAPTDIAPNSANVDEHVDTTGGLSVATLTATDPDTGETFSYSILPGGDGALFSIGGVGNDELRLDDGVLDFESKPSYSVTVRVTDSSSNTYDETLSINVNDLNDSPTSGDGSVPSVSEDVTNPSGELLSTLFGGSFSDEDAGSSISGILITSNPENGSQGVWQYSTDGGSNWFDVGSIAFPASLALDVNTRVRFVPVNNFNGTPDSLSLRVLDNTYAGGFTSGALTITSDASSPGNGSPISGTPASIDTAVTSVNDAPTITDSFAVALPGTDEDSTTAGTTVSAIVNSASWNDVDSGSVRGLAVTSANGNGLWEYSTDAVVWTSFGSVSSANALLLDATTQVRYTGDGLNGELADFHFAAWDTTSGTASTNGSPSYANPGVGGGSSAFSIESAIASTTISEINDAPSGADRTVNATEDIDYVFTTGDFGFGDVDGNNLDGVIITSLPAAGTLYIDGDGDGLIGGSEAVLASDTVSAADIAAGRLKFKPVSEASGAGYAAFDFAVKDDGGAPGQDTDPTSNTITIDVAAVNDNPISSDSQIHTGTDTNHVFTASDFNFTDVDAGDSLQLVRITAIAGSGTLELSGATVLDNDVVSRAQIDAGLLVFIPGAGESGAAYATFDFEVHDGTVFSGATSTATINVGGLDPFYSQRIQGGGILVDSAGMRSDIEFTGGTLTPTFTISGMPGSGTVVAAYLYVSELDFGAVDTTFTINGSGVTASIVGASADPAWGSSRVVTVMADVTALISGDGSYTLGGAIDLGVDDYEGASLVVVYEDLTSTTDSLITLHQGSVTHSAAGSNISLEFNGGATLPQDHTSATVTLVSFDGQTFGDPEVTFQATTAGSGTTIIAANSFGPDDGGSEQFTIDVTGLIQQLDSGAVLSQAAGGGDVLVHSFAATVVELDNAAPTLDNSGDLQLTTINEDAVTNPGDTVSSIVASDGGDRITDIDLAAVEGIAITGLTSGDGTWQFSTNGGATWNDVGSADNTSALLLRSNDHLRFVPDTIDADLANISFRAWDQTSGTAGSFADTSLNGGATAFSTDTETASISVTEVNDAPSGGNNRVATNEDTDLIFATGDFGFSDIDGNNLSAVYFTTIPGVGTLYVDANSDGLVNGSEAVSATDTVSVADISAGRLKFKPVANENGTGYASFTFQVQDNGGVPGQSMDPTANTLIIDVTPQNDAPVASDGTFSVDENASDGTSVGTVIASDPDIGDTLNFSITAGDPTSVFMIDSAGNITVADGSQLNFESTPSYTLTVEVIDSGAPGLTDTASITINLNDLNESPVINNGTFTVNENASNGTLAGTVSASDPDVGDSLVYNITAGDPTSIFFIDASGNITVADGTQLNFESTNSYALTVEVTDSGAPGLTDSAVITVNLNDVNESPLLGNNNLTISEEGTVTLGAANLSSTDPDNDPVTYLASNITGGQFELTSSPGNAITTFTEVQLSTGLVVFVHDGNEFAPAYDITVNDGSLSDGPQAATISFTNVNDAPQVAINNAISVDENAQVSISTADLDALDPDHPSNDVFFDITTNPVNGRLELSSNPGVAVTVFTQQELNSGLVRYVHLGSETTADSFQFQLRDGTGATSSIEIFNLVVNPVNDAPTLTNFGSTAAEGGNDILSAAELLATDNDNPASELTYTVTGGPAFGQLERAGAPGIAISKFTQAEVDAGIVQYVHDGSETTADQFQFDLSDDQGGMINGQTFNFGITPVNDAPVAVDDGRSLAEDQTLVASSVLSNDTDVDSSILTAQLVSGPSQADTFVLSADGTFTYRPTADYNGTDSFQYRVSDGADVSGIATVTLSISPVNDLPTGGPDSFSVPFGEALIELTGVLSNDNDVENDALIAILVASPAHGSLVLNPDGSFQYQPDSGFFGVDSFSYLPNDGSGDGTLTTVTIQVLDPPTAPTTGGTGTDPGDGEADDLPEEADDSETQDGDEDNELAQAVNAPVVPGGQPGGGDNGPGDGETLDSSLDSLFAAVDSGGDNLPNQAQALDVLEWMALQRGSGGESGVDDERAKNLPGASFAFDAAPLWQQLDELAKDVTGSMSFDFNLTTSIAVTTISATAGYVIWSLRGGFLMATLVSSLPTWSHIDPLPVLESGPGRARGVEGDETEQLFEV